MTTKQPEETEVVLISFDKRITNIETTVKDLNDDFKELSVTLKQATNDMKNWANESHTMAEETRKTIMEMSKPNYNLWGIVLTIISSLTVAFYILFYTPIDGDIRSLEVKTEQMEKEVVHQDIFDKELKYTKEILELKIKLSEHQSRENSHEQDRTKLE